MFWLRNDILTTHATEKTYAKSNKKKPLSVKYAEQMFGLRNAVLTTHATEWTYAKSRNEIKKKTC
jgi:hypothetical protein